MGYNTRPGKMAHEPAGSKPRVQCDGLMMVLRIAYRTLPDIQLQNPRDRSRTGDGWANLRRPALLQLGSRGFHQDRPRR